MKIKIFCLILNWVIFFQVAQAETFKVALAILTPFNPISNEINSVSYVGLHLYYPLFGHGNNGKIESNFLDLSKTKSLSSKFNDYRLCLKDGLQFSDGSKIQSDDLQASLSYLSELYPHLIETAQIVNEAPLCVHLTLQRPVPNLFNKLTGVASTVLKKEDVKKLSPIGFGPYKIKQTLADRLVLTYVGKSRPRFDEIEFRSIKSIADVGQDQIHDFNQMPSSQAFISDVNKANTYSVPSLKVYSLVINLSTVQERQCIQKSLMNERWGNVYGLSIIPQKLFLPWMNPQTTWRPKSTTCSLGNKKIPFLIPEVYNLKAINDELVRIGAANFFKVISLPTSDFVKWVFSGKPYVAMIGFDSSSSTASLDGDFSYYFESFFIKTNRIVTRPILKLRNIIQEATRFDISPKKREIKTRDAEQLLLNEGWLVPVGRLSRQMIFPKNVAIEEWVDKLNGFPAIWMIKS